MITKNAFIIPIEDKKRVQEVMSRDRAGWGKTIIQRVEMPDDRTGTQRLCHSWEKSTQLSLYFWVRPHENRFHLLTILSGRSGAISEQDWLIDTTEDFEKALVEVLQPIPVA